jgi:hypothetical protein
VSRPTGWVSGNRQLGQKVVGRNTHGKKVAAVICAQIYFHGQLAFRQLIVRAAKAAAG